MTDKRLYTLAIPSGARTDASAQAGQQQALQALLDSDLGSVEVTGTDPTERPLTVEIPDAYAEIRARELAELATGLDEPVIYNDLDADSSDDGFVTVSEASPGPIDPRSDRFQRIRLRVEDVGTRRSHYRSITTALADLDTGGAWGNTQAAHIAVPAIATKVRWFDAESKDRADPAIVATRSGEHRDINILDASSAPFSDPTLIYDLPYDEEGWADVRVWDSRGEGTTTADRTDADGALQMQKVFSSSHDYAGIPILESMRLRLILDESNNSLGAQRWDDSNGSYSSVSLGSSDWELYDADIVSIGMARVDAQLEFRDPTQSPTAYYSLNMALGRGMDDALWSIPDNLSGPIPSGLVSLLDPIASDRIEAPQPTKTLTTRSEVRR